MLRDSCMEVGEIHLRDLLAVVEIKIHVVDVVGIFLCERDVFDGTCDLRRGCEVIEVLRFLVRRSISRSRPP